jgi:ribosome-associated heat shock protein Hsp15
VKIDGAVVKPARNIRLGETIEVFANDLNRTVRVVGFSGLRVGPKRVTELYEDLTAPEEWERKKESLAARVLSRPRGGGRPTKRDRRKLDEFLP